MLSLENRRTAKQDRNNNSNANNINKTMFCKLKNQDAQPHTLAMTNASEKQMIVGITTNDTNTRLHINEIPLKKCTLPAIANTQNSNNSQVNASSNCQHASVSELLRFGLFRV